MNPSKWWIFKYHVDYRDGNNIHRLKLKDKNHDYEDVDLEYLENLYGNKKLSDK
jgi:hypothetical protein